MMVSLSLAHLCTDDLVLVRPWSFLFITMTTRDGDASRLENKRIIIVLTP